MIGLLGSLLGGRTGRMFGSMVGGRNGAMVGGLMGAMLGGRQLRNLGGMLSGMRGGGNGNDDRGAQDAPSGKISESDAEALIRAMCNSAKADGHVDDDEAKQIVNELGEIAEAEREFLVGELRSPMISANDVARTVPSHLSAEAYAVSVVAINVDTVEEANYLRELAGALGLDGDQVGDIHADLGVS